MTGRAKAYLDSLMGRYPSPAEAKELYRLRDLDVSDLQRKQTISLADVRTLEYSGRFRIANECLHKCDSEALHALSNDPHHGVRAAVVTSSRLPQMSTRTAMAA